MTHEQEQHLEIAISLLDFCEGLPLLVQVRKFWENHPEINISEDQKLKVLLTAISLTK